MKAKISRHHLNVFKILLIEDKNIISTFNKFNRTMWFRYLLLVYVAAAYPQQGEPLTSAILATKKKQSNVLHYAGKTYYFSTVFQGNYFQATQFCNNQGMRLVSITSQAENERLGKFAQEIGMSYAHFWTSGTNLQQEDEWIWLSTGAAFTYLNWYPGEPNKGAGDVPENCVEVRTWDSKGFTWNNVRCTNQFYFICENHPSTCNT